MFDIWAETSRIIKSTLGAFHIKVWPKASRGVEPHWTYQSFVTNNVVRQPGTDRPVAMTRSTSNIFAHRQMARQALPLTPLR